MLEIKGRIGHIYVRRMKIGRIFLCDAIHGCKSKARSKKQE
jgi:hypothetical protein